MSVPALRRPKFVTHQKEKELAKRTILPDVQYVILTLKDGKKLVVSSDSYHGFITVGESYRCVFCCTEMKLDPSLKEKHKKSPGHNTTLEKYPHMDEYSENLVRELSKDSKFCTICNVVIENMHLMRHLQADIHRQELEKATLRAENYKPHLTQF